MWNSVVVQTALEMRFRRALVCVACTIVLAILSSVCLRVVYSSQKKSLLNNVVKGGLQQNRPLTVPNQEVGQVAKTELDGMKVTKTELSETELDDSAKNQVEQTRTPRVFNPDVDLTVLRDTSFGKVG